MRAAISHLILSLVSNSLNIYNKALLLSFSHLLLASSVFPRLLAVNVEVSPHDPEGPVPHRGSGRRESMQYVVNRWATV